jgi:alkylhydroperoxidase family enzyme
VSRGATENIVDKVRHYEQSDLPLRTKAAIRLADAIANDPSAVDEAFHADLRQHFSDDEILDLGMCVAFVSGWQRFIEAFKIVPDRWADGDRLPWLHDPVESD